MKLNINPNFFVFAKSAQNAPHPALNGADNQSDFRMPARQAQPDVAMVSLATDRAALSPHAFAGYATVPFFDFDF